MRAKKAKLLRKLAKEKYKEGFRGDVIGNGVKHYINYVKANYLKLPWNKRQLEK
jgi:hypothetical protein